MSMLSKPLNRRWWLALFVAGAVAVAAWFFVGLPLDWGMSEAEVAEATRQGRKIFLNNCATCHLGEGGLPSQRDMQQDYSRRQLSRVLEAPPERMPPFSGTEEERRNLLLFLTRD